MIDENKKQTLINQYLAGYNNLDIEAMLVPLHPNIQFKNISGTEITASTSGKEAFYQLAQQSKSIFSARQQTIKSIEFLPDGSVIAQVSFCGVIATDLPNGFKKDQHLKIEGSSEFIFQDELISKITDIS